MSDLYQSLSHAKWDCNKCAGANRRGAVNERVGIPPQDRFPALSRNLLRYDHKFGRMAVISQAARGIGSHLCGNIETKLFRPRMGVRHPLPFRPHS
jgi:hypothetical protein